MATSSMIQSIETVDNKKKNIERKMIILLPSAVFIHLNIEWNDV